LPLPFLFIGIATATGGFGVGTAIKAGIDMNQAKRINQDANEIMETSTKWINAQREACGSSLHQLGEEKLHILNSSLAGFVESFSKIKNISFTETEGLEELKKFHIDEKEFSELKSMVGFAGAFGKGALTGTFGGALAAFGAYGAAQALACASTGTAIATLSGAAATNATLAFFGGGSLAAGGLGVAGGTAVLGGLVAGPALMVMGLVAGHAAKKDLVKARINREEALQIAAQLDTASMQCDTIRRRTYMFYNLLARLDARFLPLVYKLEDILKAEGDDYRQYSADSKKLVSSCASVASSIKKVLDTPILTDDGLLTDESGKTATNIEDFLRNMRITN